MPHEQPPSGGQQEPDFHALIRRVRAGDPEAAARLVRDYEPEIRRMIRVRLGDTQMRRTLDSMDICQSVMGSFFVRAARGEYRLDKPDELQNLLCIMAYHKLIDMVRKKHLPEAGPSEAENEPADRGDSPSQEAMYRELLQMFRERLSEEERQLADLRAAGVRWDEIAEQLHGQAEALRKKLDRAVQRVARSLGLEYGDDEE
jgi:RNA polymerase sigma factor (sigma-70 family)